MESNQIEFISLPGVLTQELEELQKRNSHCEFGGGHGQKWTKVTYPSARVGPGSGDLVGLVFEHDVGDDVEARFGRHVRLRAPRTHTDIHMHMLRVKMSRTLA